jgi:hypothetical protein
MPCRLDGDRRPLYKEVSPVWPSVLVCLGGRGQVDPSSFYLDRASPSVVITRDGDPGATGPVLHDRLEVRATAVPGRAATTQGRA